MMLTRLVANDYERGLNVNLYGIICCFLLFVLVDGGEDTELFFEIFAEIFRLAVTNLEGYFRDV